MKLLPLAIFAILLLPSFQLADHHFIVYNGMIRTYMIHVPPSYNGSSIPLVIVLHGGGGNSWRMREKTGFDDAADKYNFIVVYPDGTWRFSEHNMINILLSIFAWKYRFLTWNAGYCCGYAFENNIDDVGYIKLLIKKMKERYNINSSRIYVVGHSNGGILAYRVAAEINEIAAAGVVAGCIGGYATPSSTLWTVPEPSHPMAIIHIHGMRDSHLPYNGGHGENASGSRIDLSVNDTISFWVKVDGCDSVPETEYIYNNTIRVDRYKNGENGTEVVLYSLIYGEHWWPGKYYNYYNFSATYAICDFLMRHPKI